MRSLFIALAVVSIFSLSCMTCAAFAQEEKAPVPEAAAPAAAPAEAAPAPKEIAIYGEVQSADTAKNSLSIQYYDYDSDSEKTAEISVGRDTKIENAAALGNIKKGDWADVTYSVSDGKNVAKIITVEKEEEATPAPAAGTPETDLPADEY